MAFMKSITKSLGSGDKCLALLLVYSRGRRDGYGCVSPSIVSKGFLWSVCGSRVSLGAVMFLSHELSDANHCAETVCEGTTGLVCTCTFLWHPRPTLAKGI